jgi:hypothetical protein
MADVFYQDFSDILFCDPSDTIWRRDLPQLVVNVVSDLTSYSCTVNGAITEDGGGGITRRGFCYLVGTSGLPTIENSIVYEDGEFGLGAYSLEVMGMSAFQDYRIRAYAVNSAGVAYSPNFVTLVVSVAIYPDDAIIYLGDDTQYYLLATSVSGKVTDVSDEVTWMTDSSPPIAEFVKTTGLMSGIMIGEDSITLEYAGFTISTDFTIHRPLLIPQASDLEGKYLPVADDYMKLVTSQYQNSPKFLAYLRGFLDMVQDVRELATSLNYYLSFHRVVSQYSTAYVNSAITVKSGDTPFDFVEFDACEGDQLDIIGNIMGQSRQVFFKADDTASPPTDAMRIYLEDADYRIVLKNKIMINQWDGKASSMQDIWKVLFPKGKIIVQDNQDMSVDVIITGDLSDTIIQLIKNDYIFPRPQGVSVNYYHGDLPFFGFDREDEYVAGFDLGHWV